MNADTDGERDSARWLSRTEGDDRVDDGQPGAHRALGIVLVRRRVAEVNQEAVAQVLRDVALEAGDHLGADALVGAHMLTELFGIEAAGERSRADKIAKHDGELPPLGVARSTLVLSGSRRGHTHSLATSAAELVAGVVDEPAPAARS